MTDPRIASRILDLMLARRHNHHDGLTDWEFASPYELRHAIEHAAEAHRADELLTDTELLSHADPAWLVPQLDAAGSDRALQARTIYRASLARHRLADPSTRRALLALDACRFQLGEFADRWMRRFVSPWQPAWATGSQTSPALRDTLAGLQGEVAVVVCAQVRGRPVALTGGPDRPTRLWDLRTGMTVGPSDEDTATPRIVAATVGELNGSRVGVAACVDGTIRTWNLTTGYPATRPMITDRAVTAITMAVLAGRPVVIFGTEAGQVEAVDPSTGDAVGRPWHGQDVAVLSVAAATVGGLVAVTGGADHSVRVVGVLTGERVREPYSLQGPVTSVAVHHGDPVQLLAADGSAVSRFDLSSGRELPRYNVPATAVTVMQLHGRPVAVIGATIHEAAGREPASALRAGDGWMLLWDLLSDQPVTQAWRVHERPVRAVSGAVLHSRPVVVTGGDDGKARIWDTDVRGLVGRPSFRHVDRVTAATVVRVDGRRCAVTGGSTRDATVRLHDLHSGSNINLLDHPAESPGTWLWHHGEVSALCVADLDVGAVLLAASGDGVRVRSLVGGEAVGRTWEGHLGPVRALAVARLGDRVVGVTGGSDAEIRLWDVRSGECLSGPWQGPQATVYAVVTAILDDRPVAVSGGHEGVVWVHDVVSGDPVGAPWRAHTDRINTLAVSRLDGRAVVVSAGHDRTVRLWDLAAGDVIGAWEEPGRGPVYTATVARLEGSPVLFTGDERGVLLRRLPDGAVVDEIAMPDRVSALAATDDGYLVVGTGWEVVVMKREVGDQ